LTNGSRIAGNIANNMFGGGGNSQMGGDMMMHGTSTQQQPYLHLWKLSDTKAQKNGAHRSVYWVKKKQRQEDGSIKGEKWQHASR